jgi:hypothetical protein
LFNTKEVNLKRECSQVPSVFSEGRYFEIYSISNKSIAAILNNINDVNKENIYKSNFIKYKIPVWKSVKTDSEHLYDFIIKNLESIDNQCYKKEDLMKIINDNNNYYTFLKDSLGREKLFIIDVKERKLYLLTEYEL